MTEIEIIIRLILAILIGGTVGIEREQKFNWAGFRTFILVTVGATTSATFANMLVLEYGSTMNIDPSRIPSYIIASIGFLGTGAILKGRRKIRGLTTAAGIWVAASIGMALGYGYYYLALTVWAVLFSTLYLFTFIEKRIVRNRIYYIYVKTEDTVLTICDVINEILALKGIVVDTEVYGDGPSKMVIKITFTGKEDFEIDKLKETLLENEAFMRVSYHS